MRLLKTVLLTAMMALALGACDNRQEMQPSEAGLKQVTYASMTINGTELTGMVADNFADRVRAESAVALSDKDGQFACLVYGAAGEEQALDLSMDFKRSGELVYINKAGTAVKVYSGENAYLPPSLKNSATRYSSIPVFYPSVKPASIALYLKTGLVAELKIAEGQKVDFGDDVMSKVASADRSGVKLYFLTQRVKDPEREEQSDPISVVTTVATSREARARNIQPNQGPTLLLWPDNDEELSKDGFWLKGVKGDYSIAFMRLQPSYSTARHGEAKPMSGFIIDIIEGVSDSGESDLARARWWPSEERVARSMARTRFSANGVVNAVLIMPGKNAFADLSIDKDMACMSTSLLIPTNARADEMPAPLEGTIVRIGDDKLSPSLVQADPAKNGLVKLPYLAAMPKHQVQVLAWDSMDQASVSNPNADAYNIATLAHSSGNEYTIASVESIAGGSQKNLSLKSRFALFGSQTFKSGSKVVMPWELQALKPSLLRAGFFKSERRPREYPNSLPEGGTTINLEVADNDAAIQRGLMFRESLPAMQGMLFVFETPEEHEFWMKNCMMDIDVAFVDDDLEIVTIREMKKEKAGTPDTELTFYTSKPDEGGNGKVLYAVEMAGGWFAKNGIKVGDRLWLPVGHRIEPGSK